MAHAIHQIHNEVQVMNRRKRGGHHLFGFEQVIEIGAGVVGAGIALTFRINRGEVFAEGAIREIESTIW